MAYPVPPKSASQYYEPMSLPPSSPCHLLRLPSELIERALSFVGPMPAGISQNITQAEYTVPKNLYQDLRGEITTLNEAITKTDAYKELGDSHKQAIQSSFDDITAIIKEVCKDRLPSRRRILIPPNHFIFIKREAMTEIALTLEDIFRLIPAPLSQQLQLALSPSVGLPTLYCPRLKPAILKAITAASREVPTEANQHISSAMLLEIKAGRSHINVAQDTARKITHPLTRIQALRAVSKQLMEINIHENGLTTAECPTGKSLLKFKELKWHS